MSSSAESRIVTMQFNNTQFERGAQQSLTTLQKLKSALSFDNMKNGFTTVTSSLGGFASKLGIFSRLNPFKTATAGAADLGKNVEKTGTVGFDQLEGAVTGISAKFVALSTIAITALSNITSQAISSATAFVRSFSFGPVIDGLHEYETNLKSLQTVQANTDQPLNKVNASLQELNKYSDLTIYNFSEMARNVGTFTAAGVDLKTSVSSIKGIANMAALSGSSSQQAATAMYQLSQAIASGKVGLMDWNSVVNAGMGGKKLQGALAQTAIAMGKIDKAQVKGTESGKQLTIMGNSFRESIMAKPGSTSWLTSGVLTNALASLDGRYSAAALSQERLANGTLKYKNAAQVANAIDKARAEAAKNGVKYTDEQFKALEHLSTQAFHSATEVKTLGQVFDVAKESIGSGWGSTFQNIFGNLNEAKKTFTGMSNYLGTIIRNNALARNNMLAAWKKGGGRNELIEGLTNAWGGLIDILTPIHEAFRDIFPKETAKDLIALTTNFRKFAETLTISDKTAGLLYRSFAGLFAIFHIVGSIIGGVIRVFSDLLGVVGHGAGGFLQFTATIGDFLVALDKAIHKGTGFTDFFDGLAKVLSIPLHILGKVASAIGNLFSGLNAGGADSAFGGISASLDPVATAVERVRKAFSGFGEFISHTVGLAITAISNFAGELAKSFTADSFSQVLSTINTALLGGIVLMLKNFLDGGVKVDVGGGLFAQIKETLGGVTDALASMQTQLKSDVLIKIAGAVAILAAALLVLSTIDPKRLASALAGMAATLLIVNTAIAKMTTSLSTLGSAKLPLIAAGLLLLATSLLAIAAAVKIYATMDLGTMARGLLGIKVSLSMLTKSAEVLSKNSKGMIAAGAGLLILAFALKVMASAIKDYAAMDWGTMGKGLLGIAGALLTLAGAMRLMPKGMVAQAAALLILGVALKAIGSAIAQIGSLDMGVLVKGIIAMGIALAVIAGAMALMPGPTLLIQAAAMVALAGALTVIGLAIAQMGGMSVGEIAKGLITLAGALLILAGGLYLMSGSIVGAAALVIAAAALAVLVPVLVALGAMSWDMIVRGLVMLAGTFAVLGVAGLLLGPLIPLIFALSASLLILGAGLALAGVGALAFATAFGIVVAAGTAGAAVMGAILAEIVAAIPKALAAFGRGIVAFASAIANGGPAFFKAFYAIIKSLLQAAAKAIPQMGKTFMALMSTILKIVSKMTPSVIAVGMHLIVAFLAAISKNVPRIVNIASDIAVKFINGIARNLPRIIQAGANLVIKFVNGVAEAIRRNAPAMGRAGGNLASAMVEGMVKGIAAGLGRVAEAARNLAANAFHAAMDFLKAHSPSRLFMEVGSYIPAGMAIGIDGGARTVAKASENLGKDAYKAMKATMTGVAAGVPEMMHIRPTITPVLDLSEARKGAGGLSSMLAQQKMRADVSYRNAAGVSTELAAAARAAVEAATTPTKPREIKLEQNNYSPKALAPAEIYRNTKGLLALTKEALESHDRN